MFMRGQRLYEKYVAFSVHSMLIIVPCEANDTCSSIFKSSEAFQFMGLGNSITSAGSPSLSCFAFLP